ncbi:MAG: LmbE family protein, partial [Gemmatimonadetes bacterium]|nr:LmbE family protein [Gemmatimonadota bacterium]
AKDSAGRTTIPLTARAASVPWWLSVGRRGDTFIIPDSLRDNLARGEDRVTETRARAFLRVAGVPFATEVSPIVYRYADPARGERRRPVTAVPAIALLFDGEVEYARAGVAFDRTYGVHLRSSAAAPRGVTVALTLPEGLHADSLVRHAALEPFGASTLSFRVRGTLAAGPHTISATATSNGETFATGYLPITYEHIRPLRYYRPATVQVEAVNAVLPPNATVAYIPGVGDNVAPMLAQLGLAVTTIAPDQVATADLSRYGAIVVGPRAFAASDALVASAGRLQQFARAGGTVVVQYGQAEIQAPGILPYPVSLARTAARVTDEIAPVTVLDPSSRLLSSPNRITQSDFAGWTQERSTYMPTTADPHWQRLLEMHDPGEPPNENSVLVAPLGKGEFRYVTLALFRQLPAGVPGAARIFLNLLAADRGTSRASLPMP